MPLSKTFITSLLFFCFFFISYSSFAQLFGRTRPIIQYNHQVVAPPGMVYIPGGSTVIKYDQSSTDTNSSRKVSLTSFFIDRTEITNDQYRKFTEWVIDSIAIVKYLKDDKYFYKDDSDRSKTGNSNTAAASTPTTPPPPVTDTTKPTDTTKMAANTPATPTDANQMVAPDTSAPILDRRINWSKVNHEKLWNLKNTEVRAKLAPMLDENGNIKKEYYMYSFKFVKVTSTVGGNLNKKTEFKIETLNIYPNENCWTQDLTNAQLDMYVENYFKVAPFDDYPVVGVTWMQARAYAYWRSMSPDAYLNMPDYMEYYHLTYTLPTEAQWVYAAQGYYDMIVPEDSMETGADTIANVQYPSDSTVTPHDSAWVANYVHQHQAGGDTTAAATTPPVVIDTAKEAAREKRNSDRAARVAKKRSDERFNYTIADFLLKGKYGGKYGKNADGSDAYDPNNPPIDSSSIHFDPNGMLSNFKQDEGDYWEDGSALTLPVMSYAPNEFGLYNMEGNVSEWTLDAYSPSTFSFVSDINPALLYDADESDADAMRRKVVRGGSFMSNAKSLNPYYRDMELQNVSHCFIGFRCIMLAPEVLHKNVATRKKTVRGNHLKTDYKGTPLPQLLR